MSENNRIRILLSPAIERLLEHRRESDSASQIMGTAIERYQTVVSLSVPDLRNEEWMLLFDVLNGTIMWDTPASIGALEHEVADAIEYNQLAGKWDVSPEFAQRVAAMSYPEKLAIVDVAERFWARYGNQPSTVNEALRELGVPRDDASGAQERDIFGEIMEGIDYMRQRRDG